MDVRTARLVVDARFSEGDAELPNGFAEHAPMGTDALLALGLEPAAVVGWASRHEPTPVDASGPLASRRRELLDALSREPWPDVVCREVAVLAPHVGAHLFHGLIRTAHAVRGLRGEAGDPAEAALAELATGLAAWHVWAGGERGRTAPSASAAGDAAAVILDAARRGAGACARQASIVNLHAVTAPMAFLLLLDVIDPDTVAVAAAAFEHTHARHPAPPASTRTVPPGRAELDGLLTRWDAHPAKLTEAALRGFAATGDGVFLEAIEAIIGPWPAPPLTPGTPHRASEHP